MDSDSDDVDQSHSLMAPSDSERMDAVSRLDTSSRSPYCTAESVKARLRWWPENGEVGSSTSKKVCLTIISAPNPVCANCAAMETAARAERQSLYFTSGAAN